MRLLLVPALLLQMIPGSLSAKDLAPVRMTWREFRVRLPEKVELTLPNGARIQGKVLAVEEGGLRMNISKSSDRKLQPKGRRLIPRESISTLRLTEYGTKGRWIGVGSALAVTAGITAGIAAATHPDLSGGEVGVFVVIVPAVIAGGVVGASIGGYFIGKLFDKKVTMIQIEPAKP